MRKLLCALTTSLLLVGQGVLANTELRADHPDRYTVVKGDTLWDISSRFLNEPWYWPEIWQVNPQVENPHLIYPGDVLTLVYVDGKPRITKAQNAPNVVKLSPQVRSTPIETPVPTIPLDAIQSFLGKTRIVDQAVLDRAPYVLQGQDGRIVSGAGDRVYARGDAEGEKVLGVFRRSKVYTDPETGEFLGLEAKSVGQGRVASQDGEVVSLDLTKSEEEILQNDRLLPTGDDRISTSFQPSAPDEQVRGVMIAVDGGVNNIGQYDVVTVNRGAREGLEVGNVLAVFKKGQVVKDPNTAEMIELPSERAGLLMVFRTEEKLSYGLVLKATRPLALLDEVRNP